MSVSPCYGLSSARMCGAELHVARSDCLGSAWLLRTACLEARWWQACRPGDAALGVTVALPPSGGRLGALLAQTEAALTASGLPGRLLDVALSEADLADRGAELPLLVSALRDLDAGVALDGAACGREALGLLRRLPVTRLRLPPHLVRRVAGSAQSRARAGRIVRAAQEVGATSVALGVQDSVQCHILADLGCDAAQGPHFGGALSAAAFRVLAGH